MTLLSDVDLHLFNEGSHFHLYDKLGAHPLKVGDVEGTYLAVWAPDAERVFAMGDFNGWNRSSHPLRPRQQSGIWEGFIPSLARGERYKYHIMSRVAGYRVDKADPLAFCAETPPRTASVAWTLDYAWGDHEWLADRRQRHTLEAPIATYELHLGSWMRIPEEGNRSLTYRELAPRLVEYVRTMGFTHVEFLPIMEHPFYGSWGYQTTGYFAPTSRYGTPQDFMYLVDQLHQHGIGVILDWVPSHFPNDEHGLGFFDGTHLYEHADPQKGVHPDWDSFIFNYGRNEVRSFLISSALFWLDKYHADGLRVDAVASMLYLDYSRKAGEWRPNEYGGRENLEAITCLRRLNEEVYRSHPDVQTLAEESTAWPMVSRPTYLGGLGFGFKWDMGWMHDTLEYLSHEPIHRKYHQDQLTFRMLYAFSENYVLPLSHDEVVHGKGSLLAQMPGDGWQKLANLRLLLGYMYALPGKKLLFMGGELGQGREWDHEESLDWHLTGEPGHAGIQRLVADLNRVYRTEPALHRGDARPEGFQWIDASDSESSVISFLRLVPADQGEGEDGPIPLLAEEELGEDLPIPLLAKEGLGEVVLVVCNFTPVPRFNYQVGVPRSGFWEEVLNTDALDYGGSGHGNLGGAEAAPAPCHGQAYSMNLTLPPLAAVFLRRPGTGMAP